MYNRVERCDESSRDRFIDRSRGIAYVRMTTDQAARHGPILALDTSTRHGVLVLFDPVDGREWTADLDPAASHGRELVPAIQRLMNSAGFEFEDLTRIAVGIGPGSYTGLRVGVAIAKTVAEVLSVPVLPVDSLLLSVLDLPHGIECRTCVAVADAQRGAVYESAYDQAANERQWTKTTGPEIRPWGELDRWKCRDHVVLTGPGLALEAKLGPIDLLMAPTSSRNPSPSAMFRWLREYAEQTDPVPIDSLEPLYIRPSAAEEKRASTESAQSS